MSKPLKPLRWKDEEKRVKELGAALRATRLKADPPLTMQQMAGKLGVSYYTYLNWENGQRAPSVLTVVDVAHIAGVDPCEILRGISAVQPYPTPPPKARGRKPKRPPKVRRQGAGGRSQESDGQATE